MPVVSEEGLYVRLECLNHDRGRPYSIVEGEKGASSGDAVKTHTLRGLV